MNIPDEVRKTATAIGFGESGWADYEFVAEWARKEAARQVRDYWDACGDFIDSNNGARLAFEAVAAQIVED